MWLFPKATILLKASISWRKVLSSREKRCPKTTAQITLETAWTTGKEGSTASPADREKHSSPKHFLLLLCYSGEKITVTFYNRCPL